MMEYLFDSATIRKLDHLTRRRTLLAFDFDGTLCPIVATPEHALLPSSTQLSLQFLAERASVAVISGRAVADVRSRLTCQTIQVVGNHGAEGLMLPDQMIEATSICVEWLRLIKVWQDSDPASDFEWEDKGLSISLHFRSASNRRETENFLNSRIPSLFPVPRVVAGKCVLNLIPVQNPGKGAAVLELMRRNQCDRTLFVGDDVTDEDVFCLKDERIFGVRITEARGSCAEYFLRNQLEIDRLLDHLQLGILSRDDHTGTQ